MGLRDETWVTKQVGLPHPPICRSAAFVVLVQLALAHAW